MKFLSWCLLIVSAVLYAVPLIFHAYGWWIAFLFPIPLFYIATDENLGFRHGFIWGIISVFTHLTGIIIGIDGFTCPEGGFARMLPGVMLVTYGGICSGIWFWITTRIKKWLELETPWAIIALWVCTLWCFIFFFDRLVLWPFGVKEGYFAFHPILALATHPRLLMLMPFIGKNLLALLMYLVPASITLFLVQPTIRNACFILLALMPWGISLILPSPPAHNPEWLAKIAVLPASFPNMENNFTQIEIAQQHFRMIEQDNPQVEIILLPESSFYCNQLSVDPRLCALWSEDYLGKPMHIILGGFRWDGPLFRNTLHWVYNGSIKNVFDKRHAVALTERIPPLINIGVVQGLFFQNFPQINPSQVERPLFAISDTIEVTPYICSELFFNEYPDDNHPESTILATTNDRWCLNLYVTELMYLDARLKAILWERDIIYVSFKYAAYLDKYGHETPILRATT